MGGSFRRPKEAKIDPKCDPKRTKIEDKNEDKNKTFFKIVLKRSWSHLGPILGPSDLQNRALALGGDRFFKVNVFEKDKASRGDLGRS